MTIEERLAGVMSEFAHCIKLASEGKDFSGEWEDADVSLQILKSHIYNLRDIGPEQYEREEAERQRRWLEAHEQRKLSGNSSEIRPGVVDIRRD